MGIWKKIKEALKRILPPPVHSFMREMNILKRKVDDASKKEMGSREKQQQSIIELKKEIAGLNSRINRLYELFDNVNRETLRCYKESLDIYTTVDETIKDFSTKAILLSEKTDLLLEKTNTVDKKTEYISERIDKLDGVVNRLENNGLHISDQIELALDSEKNNTETVIKNADSNRESIATQLKSMREAVESELRESLDPQLYPHYLKEWYINQTGNVLNLDDPRSFNEKIQWTKLYDIDSLKTLCADKYLVRDYVKKKAGSQFLTQLYGVYDRFDDIDFDFLPDRFVIKANHGSGMNIVVLDKSKLNMAETRRKVNAWLRNNYAVRYGLELQYKDIPRKIIIEEYLDNDGDLPDYKLWCFDGKVKLIEIITGRNNNPKMIMYDTDWNVLPYTTGAYPLLDEGIEKPVNLGEMIKVAEQLSADFAHVRVDLYLLKDNTIKFGELTFTSSSGVARWTPNEADMIVGQMFNLPRRKTTKKR